MAVKVPNVDFGKFKHVGVIQQPFIETALQETGTGEFGTGVLVPDPSNGDPIRDQFGDSTPSMKGSNGESWVDVATVRGAFASIAGRYLTEAGQRITDARYAWTMRYLPSIQIQSNFRLKRVVQGEIRVYEIVFVDNVDGDDRTLILYLREFAR